MIVSDLLSRSQRVTVAVFIVVIGLRILWFIYFSMIGGTDEQILWVAEMLDCIISIFLIRAVLLSSAGVRVSIAAR